MSFQLTPAHVQAILGPTAQENWAPFLESLDQNVHWMINDPTYNELSKAGTYNLQTWNERVGVPVMGRLKTPLRMEIDTLEIVGLKAIVEASGFATQKNGKPYNNKFCWILIFDGETGKVVTVREYMNTALVKEVMETNEL